MKIKCVIIDDEPANLKQLQLLVDDINDVDVIKSFTNADEFLKEHKKLNYNFCVMDINMEKTNGIECAKKINKPVIFVTANDYNAEEILAVENVEDYIKKPVNTARLEKSIKAIRNRILNEKGYVYFDTLDNGRQRFLIDEIVYFDCDKDNSDYKILYSINEKKEGLIKNNLKKITYPLLLEKLPQEAFVQINNQIVISKKHYESHKQKSAKMKYVDFKTLHDKFEVTRTFLEKYYTFFEMD